MKEACGAQVLWPVQLRRLSGTFLSLDHNFNFEVRYYGKLNITASCYEGPCGKTYNLTAEPMVIQSENYPNNYENCWSCAYLFNAARGEFVSVIVDDLALEDDYDILLIGNGHDISDNSSIIARLTGNVPGDVVTSDTSAMWMTFQTDYTTTNIGFSLRVYSSRNICGNVYNLSETMTIRAENCLRQDENDTICAVLFRAHEGSFFRVHVVDLQLIDGEATLTIGNDAGMSIASTISTMSGIVRDSTFFFYSPIMWLKFETLTEATGSHFALDVHPIGRRKMTVDIANRREPQGGLVTASNTETMLVCGDNFTRIKGDMLCEELGFPGAQSIHPENVSAISPNVRWLNGSACLTTQEFENCYWRVGRCYSEMFFRINCQDVGFVACVECNADCLQRDFSVHENRPSFEASATAHDCVSLCRTRVDALFAIMRKKSCYCAPFSHIRDRSAYTEDCIRQEGDATLVYNISIGFCEMLGEVNHGYWDADGSRLGSILHLQCDDGYGTNGSEAIQCVAPFDGSVTQPVWNSTIPTCQLMDPSIGFCEMLGDVDHGHWDADGSRLGSILHLQCNDGYIINGSEAIQCVTPFDGSATQPVWNSTTPSCQLVERITSTSIPSTSHQLLMKICIPTSGAILLFVIVTVWIYINHRKMRKLRRLTDVGLSELNRRPRDGQALPSVDNSRREFNAATDMTNIELSARPRNVEHIDGSGPHISNCGIRRGANISNPSSVVLQTGKQSTINIPLSFADGRATMAKDKPFAKYPHSHNNTDTTNSTRPLPHRPISSTIEPYAETGVEARADVRIFSQSWNDSAREDIGELYLRQSHDPSQNAYDYQEVSSVPSVMTDVQHSMVEPLSSNNRPPITSGRLTLDEISSTEDCLFPIGVQTSDGLCADSTFLTSHASRDIHNMGFSSANQQFFTLQTPFYHSLANEEYSQQRKYSPSPSRARHNSWEDEMTDNPLYGQSVNIN